MSIAVHNRGTKRFIIKLLSFETESRSWILDTIPELIFEEWYVDPDYSTTHDTLSKLTDLNQIKITGKSSDNY